MERHSKLRSSVNQVGAELKRSRRKMEFIEDMVCKMVVELEMMQRSFEDFQKSFRNLEESYLCLKESYKNFEEECKMQESLEEDIDMDPSILEDLNLECEDMLNDSE